MRVVEERLRRFYATHGHDLRHLWVLFAVRDSRMSQGDCADAVGINRNVMVRIVDAMENRGLVLRRRNPENRKEVQLIVTKKGRDILAWADTVRPRAMKNAYAPLSPEIVEEITKHMREIVGPTKPPVSQA